MGFTPCTFFFFFCLEVQTVFCTFATTIMLSSCHQSNLMIPLVSTTILAVIIVLHHRFVSKLSRIPAIHPLATVTSLYMLWIRYKGRENQAVYLAHKRLGPVIRLGPSELSINCVDDGLRTIYQNPSFEKTSFYSVFENFG